MKFTYIGADGNIKETEDVTLTPDFLEKIDNTWFEKRGIVETKKSKKEVEVTEQDIWETVVEIVNNDEAYLAFLKEKKIRGAHLLKGDKLKEKAISEGFII